MDKFYGYAGKLLRVDLTNEQITEEELDAETARKYVGGTGVGAKYLYVEVPPGVEWSDPENRLIFASGPLGGSRAPGSGTFSLVTKGPLTNLAAASQANGYFGAYIRFSGFEAIIVQGVAQRPVYLHLHDGIGELMDASHLWGKDIWETETLIKKELRQRERGMSVMAIGPAGENLVKFAAVGGDKGHFAGTNGTGAVMGSKKLKAIAAARGKGTVPVKDAKRLSSLATEMFEDSRDHMLDGALYKWGTAGILPSLHEGGMLPTKNYITNIFPDYQKFSGVYIRGHFQPKPSPCWACRMAHAHRVTVTEGQYQGYEAEEPEYEGMAAFGPLIGQTDPGATVMLNDTNDRLGMDLKESGFVLSLAMECYEKGIITREDTDGVELRWGNAEAARVMLERIARRQGFGNVLAEGVMRAAEHIGLDAQKFAIYAKKGIAPHTHQLQGRLQARLNFALSSSGSNESGLGGLSDAAELGIEQPTDIFSNIFSAEQAATFAAQSWGIRFQDHLVLCSFTSGMSLKNLVACLNAATGWDFTVAEAADVSRRTAILLRSFGLRHGLTPDQEIPSSRMEEAPVDGPLRGKGTIPNWDETIRRFYELMGWDGKTGKPLPDTLRRLGLEYVIPDLWER